LKHEPKQCKDGKCLTCSSNHAKMPRRDVIEYIFSVADYILVKYVGGELG